MRNIINVNEDEIEWYGDDSKDDEIIMVNDIVLPEQGGPIPHVDPTTNEDNNKNNKESGSSDSDDEDDDDYRLNYMNDVPTVKDNTPPTTEDNVSIPGVCRSKRKNRVQTSKYAKYGLMMAAR